MSEAFAHNLTWSAGEVPVSERFGDAFYSRHDGRAEAGHVFLAGNDLPQRFSEIDRFVVAELGFGTGLNFIETRRVWERVRTAGQRLQFVSFEGFPITPDAMKRALARWPDLSQMGNELAERWAGIAKGVDVFEWQCDSQAELLVFIGQADQTVGVWDGFADAWYLDGFAPARNQEMWSSELLGDVFERTRRGGTFATYTAAGWVRRNLAGAGFVVEKRPGFGGKREMLCGMKP